MKKGDLVRFKQPENHALFLCLGDRIRFVRDHQKLKAMVEVENAITTQWVRKDDIEIVEEKSVDELIREAERNKDHSPEKRGEWLNRKLHLGHFSVGQLEFMAHCGDRGAVAAGFRREPEFLERFVGLLEFGPRPMFVALAALSLEVDKLHRIENPNNEEIDAFKEFGLRVAMALDALDAKGLVAANTWSKAKASVLDKGKVLEAVRETLEETIGAGAFEELVAGLRASIPLLTKYEKRICDAVWPELVKWAESGGRKWRPEGHTEDPEPLEPIMSIVPDELAELGELGDLVTVPEGEFVAPALANLAGPDHEEFLRRQLDHHEAMAAGLRKALEEGPPALPVGSTFGARYLASTQGVAQQTQNEAEVETNPRREPLFETEAPPT